MFPDGDQEELSDGNRKVACSGIQIEADFYSCGTTGFLADIHRGLLSVDVPPDSMYQEVFGSATSIEPGVTKGRAKSPHSLAGTQCHGPLVSLTRSGLAVRWNNRFGCLLELAEACDAPVKWSCRTGVCHMCEWGILDGRRCCAPEPLDQSMAGNALICCSTPESQVHLDL
jgi:hypothetical protein